MTSSSAWAPPSRIARRHSGYRRTTAWGPKVPMNQGRSRRCRDHWSYGQLANRTRMES